VQEVEIYGPLFEHWLGLKPWDLDRLSRAQVEYRLAWLKQHRDRTSGIGEVAGDG
jgi:hypothetical protein